MATQAAPRQPAGGDPMVVRQAVQASVHQLGKETGSRDTGSTSITTKPQARGAGEHLLEPIRINPGPATAAVGRCRGVVNNRLVSSAKRRCSAAAHTTRRAPALVSFRCRTWGRCSHCRLRNHKRGDRRAAADSIPIACRARGRRWSEVVVYHLLVALLGPTHRLGAARGRFPPGRRGEQLRRVGRMPAAGNELRPEWPKQRPGGYWRGGPSLTAARVPGSSGKVAVSTQVAGWVAAGAGVAAGTGLVTGRVGSFLG